ncbi:MAG: hypothetical protein WC747_01065 [Candidatus Babeliales bacterium]|jgi:hypothetical protein
MVRGRKVTSVARRQVVTYKPGSVCFVLSPQDCMSLVQFYSLLMKIERRMKDSLQSSLEKENNISPRKTKGSQLCGPSLFLRVFAWGCGWVLVQLFLNFTKTY